MLLSEKIYLCKVNDYIMIKISGVVITYNEEKYIENCIQSMLEIADEIVIVDSYSTDRTKEICLKYNVRFIEQKFLGYIEQKNYANSLANGEYILSLDADEALSEELKKEVKALKQSNNLADGYWVNRLNNYCGTWIKYSHWYPDKRIRLFKKDSGEWQGGNPHDFYTMYPNKKTAKIDADILHWAYDSISEHYLKIDNFTTIAAHSYIKNKNKKVGFVKIVFNPFWKFFQGYFLKKGFLDGFQGFVICCFASFGTFLKYVKIRELQQNAKKQSV